MKKNLLIIIFSIFVFSIVFHIKGITSPLLDFQSWRQTQTAMVARNYYENGFKFFHPQVDWSGRESNRRAGTEFPVFSFLIALLYKIFGVHDILGRFLAVFISACSAVYLFLLLRKFFEFWSAYIASLIFSAIPIKIYFTRTVQPESLMLFSIIAGFYYFICYLENSNIKIHIILSWIFLVLAPLVKLPSLYILLPVAYLSYHKWDRKFLYRIDIWCFNVLLVLCVWIWYRYAKSGIGVLPLEFSGFLAMLKIIGQPHFWTRNFLSRFPELTTTYAGLIFFAVGFWNIVLKKRQIFFGVWFFSVVIYIIFIGEYGYIHQYTVLHYAPINAAFMGAGVGYLWTRFGNRKVNKILIILLVMSIPINSIVRIRKWYRLDNLWLLKAGRIVAELSSPKDLFLCNTRGPRDLYHIHRKGFQTDIRIERLERIKNIIKKDVSFFLTATNERWTDNQSVSRYFLKNYPIAYRDEKFLIFDLRKKI
ncbi:MAG: glycosyltransferase family 39 protein [Elusimicrobia bacterium]|nr:glycosyltransferase family 39 protein [Elusimicrobiota bacterium]